jgi:hypothetical protein
LGTSCPGSTGGCSGCRRQLVGSGSPQAAGVLACQAEAPRRLACAKSLTGLAVITQWAPGQARRLTMDQELGELAPDAPDTYVYTYGKPHDRTQSGRMPCSILHFELSQSFIEIG